MIEDLPRSAYWTYADARCSAQITGWLALALTLARVFSSPSPVDPKEWIANRGAPIGAGNDCAGNGVALGGQAGLMQSEGEFDDVGNSVGGRAFAALILECIAVAACCEKPLFEMPAADDAEMLGSNRLAVSPHRRQQPGDAVTIDLIDAEELRQRLVRTACLGQYPALDGSPGKPAEFGDELTHRAVLLEVAVPCHVRGEIALPP
jgi:hypothetical protein